MDRPPFPLPIGVDVPVYFTIQPGGASLATHAYGPGLFVMEKTDLAIHRR